MKKLRWINGQHLRALPQEKLSQLLRDQLAAAGVLADGASEAFVNAAAAMVAEKVELVNDAEPLVREALGYPLAETLESSAAAPFIEDGSAAEVRSRARHVPCACGQVVRAKRYARTWHVVCEIGRAHV